jgi:ankyrin repeat protein
MNAKRRVTGLAGVLSAAVLLSAATAVQGPSPVADAAMRRDIEAVRTLLKQGADVNAAQGDGMSALHWAAEHGQAAMAEMLIAAGANVRAVTRIGGYTPLHVASRSGSGVVVKALVKAGSEVNATTASGATALHFAAGAGSVEAVTALLDGGADPNARENSWGQTPLIFAAAYNRAAAITTLLERRADPAIATRAEGATAAAALEQAASRRRNEVLAAIRGGDDRENGPPPTPSQIQAAIVAGRAVYDEVKDVDTTNVREEADTADGQVAGYGGSVGAIGGLTALHHAVRQGNLEATKALLDGGAPIDQPSGGDHTTPLLMATINGQFDAAMILIERGANPNIASDAGATPLYSTINAHWMPKSRYPQPQAVQNQKTPYLQVMEALLKAGADPNARIRRHLWYFAYNNCGNGNCGLEQLDSTTAFWRATYSVDVDAMRLLVAHGADHTLGSIRPAGGGRGGRGGRGGGRGGGRADDDDDDRAGGFAARGGGGGRGEPDRADSAAMTEVRRAASEALGAARAGDQRDERQIAQARGAEPAARRGRGAGASGAATGRGGPGGRGETTPLGARDSVPARDTANVSGAPANVGGTAQDPDARAAPVGKGVDPIHAAAGVGYGNGFAANSHRHAPDGWLPAMKYLVEELGADVNARDFNGYTPLHHAAARGDNEMILYLVSKGADPKAVARNGRTTIDIANGPVQRLRPFLETIALLEKLGAKNNHRCVSC